MIIVDELSFKFVEEEGLQLLGIVGVLTSMKKRS